jgi:nitroreductase
MTLFSRRERWRPVIDPENREFLISIGALAHSLRVCAAAAGYELREDWLVRSAFDEELALFTLTPAPVSRSEELDALLSVRTWRREYRHEPISVSKLESVERLIGNGGAVSVKGSGSFKRIVDSSVEAAVTHANKRAIYDELSPYLYHPKRKEDQAWGVVSPFSERKGAREFFWNRLSSPRTPLGKGYRAATITDTRDLLHQAPALVALGGDAEDPASLLEVGARYQALRIEAHRLGLSTQPVSVLPQIAASGEIEMPEDLAGLQMLIRIGVPLDGKKEPRSVREDAHTLILSPEDRERRRAA